MLRKEGEDSHQEDVKHAGAWKEKNAQEEMIGQIRDDMKEYKMTEDMAQNRRNAWQMMTKASPILHVGGLQARRR